MATQVTTNSQCRPSFTSHTELTNSSSVHGEIDTRKPIEIDDKIIRLE